jgi:hypothetical protein
MRSDFSINAVSWRASEERWLLEASNYAQPWTMAGQFVIGRDADNGLGIRANGSGGTGDVQRETDPIVSPPPALTRVGF